MVIQSVTIARPTTEVSESDGGTVQRILWTRDDLYRALDLALFDRNLKMELIGGELFAKLPQKRPHSSALANCQEAARSAFPQGHYVAVRSPLWIDDLNEPEPDVMVVRGNPDDYADQPRPSDVKLLIEISDTTLHGDRVTKAEVYARGGVQDYLVLLIKSRTLEVRREPTSFPDGFGYASITIHKETDAVSPLYAPGAAILVADLLPRADTTG